MERRMTHLGSLPPSGSSFDGGASDRLTTGKRGSVAALKACRSSVKAEQAMLAENNDGIPHICESGARIRITLRECLISGW